MSIYNSIYVNHRTEIKRGVPILLIEIRGAKVQPSGAIFLLMKAMRHNCTIILRNTKSNVQKSGNIRKGEVTKLLDIENIRLGCLYAKMYLWYKSFFQVKIAAMVTKSR